MIAQLCYYVPNVRYNTIILELMHVNIIIDVYKISIGIKPESDWFQAENDICPQH